MPHDISKQPEIVGADFCKFYYYDGYSDLSLCEIGNYKCEPGYSYGPVVRKENIFHFVLSGRGTLTINEKKYRIEGGQGFLIPDAVLAYYEADHKNPWSYVWIHVAGPKANEAFQRAGITAKHPIFTPSDDPKHLTTLFMDLLENNENEFYCMARTYEILDFIIGHSTNKVQSQTNRQLDYVRKVIKFVQLKYNEQIHVEEIAIMFGLNRSYLSRLFKEATGRTIQDYILSCRMNEAKRYLACKDYSIQYVAYAVGYNDTFTFSKAFKRFTGLSPSEFKEKNEKE